jgi:hypothetical protein
MTITTGLPSENPAVFCLSPEHDNVTFFPITKTPTHPLAFPALCNVSFPRPVYYPFDNDRKSFNTHCLGV